jgi:HK97 family phage portal protein
LKFIENILGRYGYYKRSGTKNPAQWFIDWITGGSTSSSGATVNESSALKYSPFWSATRIISGTIAALPFMVYLRMADNNKERAINHPVYHLLHTRPNEFMDAITFIETRHAHVLTYGNGYAEIQRNGGGKPIALWPLLPDRTTRKISDDGVPFYEVTQATGPTVQLPDYNVLHIKGLGFDGYTGYNVVAFQKEAIGYGIGVKEYGGRFFGNDANPGGVLEHPQALGDKAYARLLETWEKNHQGLTKAHRVAILEEGMKWSSVGVSPEQAQALDVQKYTVDDCARIFNIPPHKIASLERATFSNIEELNIDFVTQTLLYWFRKWEEECDYKLFLPSERNKYFCEILAEGLLRGNTKSRYESYNIGRNAGFLSVNDIRRLENMNTIGPDGDIYLEPLNMKEAGSEPDDSVDDDVRAAHRAMLISQIMRVIKKGFSNLGARRNFAKTILFEPLDAYASTLKSGIDVARMLDIVIDENINGRARLVENDAGRIADSLLNRIGDNHANT